MTAAERVERAAELLDQAVAELEEAEPDMPDYAVEATVFARAETRVTIRRLKNLRTILTGTRAGR